jgi:hypothetical protein
MTVRNHQSGQYSTELNEARKSHDAMEARNALSYILERYGRKGANVLNLISQLLASHAQSLRQKELGARPVTEDNEDWS